MRGQQLQLHDDVWASSAPGGIGREAAAWFTSIQLRHQEIDKATSDSERWRIISSERKRFHLQVHSAIVARRNYQLQQQNIAKNLSLSPTSQSSTTIYNGQRAAEVGRRAGGKGI